MAGKNIKLIQNEIADAVEKFNSCHSKKLEFKSAEHIKNCSEICYIAKYSFGDKEVQLIGCKHKPCYGCTSEDDLEFMDEFLETLA